MCMRADMHSCLPACAYSFIDASICVGDLLHDKQFLVSSARSSGSQHGKKIPALLWTAYCLPMLQDKSLISQLGSSRESSMVQASRNIPSL